MRYYFDWAATAIPDVFTREIPFANPSSKHYEGRMAKAVLEDARDRCAHALGVNTENLYWTSGGTESNAMVLFSVMRRRFKTSGGILAGASEHASIRSQKRIFEEAGIPFNFIDIEKTGAIPVQALQKALDKQKNTCLITCMHVNNETGAINDIAYLARAAKENAARKIHFHCDMVQSLGKIKCSLNDLGVDSASFSAHKLGGPRGIGLLYMKTPLDMLICGGGQERGVRSGTENVYGAAVFAECIEKRLKQMDSSAECRMERLILGLKENPRCLIIPEEREALDKRFSPYILQAAFSGIPGEVLVRVLDDAGFAISTGAACSSADKKRPVLDAMGIDMQKSLEAIRISQGWSTSNSDIAALLSAITKIIQQF
ncbi:MAG: cysteine desulfurase [Spirochaetaceae bacterium]|jgi:cysteine desulfurase|nr:cysteine desulfurase [Spirochaetaceae bacterium]